MFKYFRGKTKEEPKEELKQEQWIPVTERLPEKTGRYLVTSCQAGEKYVTDTAFLADMKDDPTGPWLEFGVTAWMPLPEPYEEEK